MAHMKTIVFAATKGGTGKTSLCFNVAIEAAKQHQVLVADLDPQRSLKTMWEKRGEMLNPRLVSNVHGLAQSIKLLSEAGYDREFMFVDTPGSLMPVIRDAISAADLVVLPVQPSPMDWAAQEAVADLVESIGMRDRTLFVVNRVEGRSDLVDRAKAFFEMRTKFPIPIVKQRANYARGFETGKAGFEVSGNKEAATEIKALWKAIREALDSAVKQTLTTQEDKTDDRRQLH
jgi:chromosome partitioning protein